MKPIFWQQEFTRIGLQRFGYPLTLHWAEDKEIGGVRIALTQGEDGAELFTTRIPMEMAIDVDGDDPYWEIATKDLIRAAP